MTATVVILAVLAAALVAACTVLTHRERTRTRVIRNVTTTACIHQRPGENTEHFARRVAAELTASHTHDGIDAELAALLDNPPN